MADAAFRALSCSSYILAASKVSRSRFSQVMEEETSQPRCFSTPGIVGPSATFQRAGGACVYLTSNSMYGSRYPTEMRPPRFGLSNKFSKSVGEFPRLESTGPSCKAMATPLGLKLFVQQWRSQLCSSGSLHLAMPDARAMSAKSVHFRASAVRSREVLFPPEI
eukprot:Skav222656  [mRNA]  locus=scaffold997:241838:249513:- [translate_table: standard]